MGSFIAARGLFVVVRGLLSSCGAQPHLPRGMWDLSSPTRDRTSVPLIRRQTLNHWTTREVPLILNKDRLLVCFTTLHYCAVGTVVSSQLMVPSTAGPCVPNALMAKVDHSSRTDWTTQTLYTVLISDCRDFINFSHFVWTRGGCFDKCIQRSNFFLLPQAANVACHYPGLSDSRSWVESLLLTMPVPLNPGCTFKSSEEPSQHPYVWDPSPESLQFACVVPNGAWHWVCCQTLQFILMCGQGWQWFCHSALPPLKDDRNPAHKMKLSLSLL